MRLVFFGTGSFAVPSLERLAPHVVLVVTQPDRPAGRGGRLQPSAVKLAALELGLDVATPEKTRAPEFVEILANLQPDALVVASYGQILSQRVLDSASRGGINLHGSLLPRYRGAAPIQRAIQNGDLETGITLMQMDRGMDTGDMIEKVSIMIEPDATYGEVQDQLAEVAANMIEGWLPRIKAGTYPREPQNCDLATIAPKVEKCEAELSIARSAKAEFNRYRAFTPAPGAFLRTDFGPVRISRAALGETVGGEPGDVVGTKGGCEIVFLDGSIKLLEVQPEGKKRMSGQDFANGLRLKPGSKLVTPS